jgi:hypothetical protein
MSPADLGARAQRARIPSGMSDRGDLENRLAKLERAVAEVYDKCAIEAFATRLSLFPNADEAGEWRQKLEEARERQKRRQ